MRQAVCRGKEGDWAMLYLAVTHARCAPRRHVCVPAHAAPRAGLSALPPSLGAHRMRPPPWRVAARRTHRHPSTCRRPLVS
eukprot:scaffold496_cov380-Prasinococcus_capsulatus_cf.AAC.4